MSAEDAPAPAAAPSDSAAPDSAAPDPAADEARARLRAAVVADPDAVLEDDAVVDALLRAHAGGGRTRNVVDLRGALVERLETRLSRLEQTHRSVISAAYDNLSGASQVHRAVLAMLEPVRFSGVLKALEEEIPAILGVERLALALETDAPEALPPSRVLVALPRGEVARYFAADLPEELHDAPQRDVALRRIVPGADAVFGGALETLGSEALVRLDFGANAPPGLVAFGSADARRFTPDQGGDLLEFFGGALARAVRRWIAPPQ